MAISQNVFRACSQYGFSYMNGRRKEMCTAGSTDGHWVMPSVSVIAGLLSMGQGWGLGSDLCWGEGKKGCSPGSVRGSPSCLITPTCGPSLRDQLPGAHKQGPVVGLGILMESPSIPELWEERPSFPAGTDLPTLLPAFDLCPLQPLQSVPEDPLCPAG